MHFDDTGDNISSHNAALNENTSIFWLWKHLSEFEPVDCIGFNHYRRFFPRQALESCKKFDIAVAKPIKCLYSLEWQYGYYHCADDLRVCIDVLKEHDYAHGSSFEQYMKQCNDNFAPMNMFTMRKGLFNEWCSFIFPVLLDLEKRIDVSGRDNY